MAAPTLDSMPDVTLSAGGTLLVRLNGGDADNDTLTFTAASGNASITPTVTSANNRSLRIRVRGVGDTPAQSQEMTLQLLEDMAPRTTAHIIQLVQQGFYNEGDAFVGVDPTTVPSLAILNAMTFTVTDGSGKSATFEFVDTSVDSNTSNSANKAVTYNSTSATYDTVRTAMVTAINAAGLSCTARAATSGAAVVFTGTGATLDRGTSPFTASGDEFTGVDAGKVTSLTALDGKTFTINDGTKTVTFEFVDTKVDSVTAAAANKPITFDSNSTSETIDTVRAKMVAAINNAGLNGTAKAVYSGMVVVEGTNVVLNRGSTLFTTPMTFHRAVKGFMIQAGSPYADGTGGSALGEFDDEYNADLRFTSSGLLAMAKTDYDTNDSQFFITGHPGTGESYPRHLDFLHTIFGFLTTGDAVLSKIEDVPVLGQSPRSNTEISKPRDTVVIDSISVFQDASNGVLLLKAPKGATGSGDVTVTVSDGHGGTATRTFHVTIQPDTTVEPPYLQPISPIRTTAGTPKTITLGAVNVSGVQMLFDNAPNNDVPIRLASAIVDAPKTSTQMTISAVNVAIQGTGVVLNEFKAPFTVSGNQFTRVDSTTVPKIATLDGKIFTISDSDKKFVTFEFVDKKVRSESMAGRMGVLYDSRTDSIDTVRTAMVSAINAVGLKFTAQAATGAVTIVGTGAVLNDNVDGATLSAFSTSVASASAPAQLLAVDSGSVAKLADLDAKLVRITDGDGKSVTFEFVDKKTRSKATGGHTAVLFDSRTGNMDKVRAALVKAVNDAPLKCTAQEKFAVGVYKVLVGVIKNNDNSAKFDAQWVPVYVSPKALASVQLAGTTGTDVYTRLNNTAGKAMTFNVTGLVTGHAVTLSVYADRTATSAGTLLATKTLNSTTTTTAQITTDGHTTLSDGVHTITILQSLKNQTVDVGNLQSTVDLDSAPRTMTVRIQTAVPRITSSAPTAASVGRQYAYNVATNLVSGVPVNYSLTTRPAGMTIDSAGHIRWTPQPNQWPSQAVTVRLTDMVGNVARQSFRVNVADSTQDFVANAVVDLPADASGSQATLRRSGTKIELVNDRTGLILFTQPVNRTLSMQVLGGSQADRLTVSFAGGSFDFADGLDFEGGGGSNTLVVRGGSGSDVVQVSRTSIVAGALTITPSGLAGIRLEGGPGHTTFRLSSSAVPVSVVDTGGSTALDFSKATGGVTVNLGLNAGQTQTIAPLRTTLAITGAISELIGTKYADVLTGGRAGTTILRGMAGNDVLRAGSGNNVLLGGAGDDTLYGSPNSNLLIGGRGADKLYGSSGSDILVGGTTIYDDFDGALLAILAEGPVRSMFHPSGSRLKLGDTVQDDGARNQLFGGGGQNWYLPGSNDSWSS